MKLHIASLSAFQFALFLAVSCFFQQGEDVALGFLFASLFLLPLGRKPSFLLAGFLVSTLIHIFIYERYSGLGFSLIQVIENPIEAFQSVINVLGETWTIFAIMEFVVTAILSAWLIDFIFLKMTQARKFSSRMIYASSVLLFVPAFVQAFEIVKFYKQPAGQLEIRFEGDPEALPQSDESLIYLQLESLNSSALFKEDGRQAVPRLDFPGLKKLEAEGATLLPYFWSNTFGTHLGMSSILCGASGAMTIWGVPLKNEFPCLPTRFNRAGYYTAFYYSYDSTDFYNIQETVDELGFTDFFYGKKLMRAEDPLLKWGYNDCTFFDRAFDDMKARGIEQKKKIFVYMSVHMNHIPFENHLDIEHPFSKPRDSVEKYLNSAFEQDYCMGSFLEKVKSLKRDDLHVMISGDHGFPVYEHRELFDHYMTSLFYLPPKKRSQEFKSGIRSDVSPAQDQIQSTILELFGAPRGKSSFVWALKGEDAPSDFRHCHLIADVTGGNIYAIEKDQFVEKFSKSNIFLYHQYNGLKRTSLARLTSAKDWAQVTMSRPCLDRLGAPKF